MAVLALLLAFLVWWLWLSGPSDPPNADVVYTDHSYRPKQELADCLLLRDHIGGIGKLDRSGIAEIRNRSTGLTVRIEDRHDFLKIWVFVDRGKTFTLEQRTAVKLCTGRPDNR